MDNRKRLPLINQSDIDDWEDFIKTGTMGTRKIWKISARRWKGSWYLPGISKRPMKLKISISLMTRQNTLQ